MEKVLLSKLMSAAPNQLDRSWGWMPFWENVFDFLLTCSLFVPLPLWLVLSAGWILLGFLSWRICAFIIWLARFTMKTAKGLIRSSTSWGVSFPFFLLFFFSCAPSSVPSLNFFSLHPLYFSKFSLIIIPRYFFPWDSVNYPKYFSFTMWLKAVSHLRIVLRLWIKRICRRRLVYILFLKKRAINPLWSHCFWRFWRHLP